MATDRGYTNLLAHLHRPSTSLALSAIQAVLAHHLAHLSPLPTPLAATAVSAPLFISEPLTHPKVQALSTAFRHASHIKFRALNSPSSSGFSALFRRSLGTRISQWLGAMIKGVQGGQPVMRLACCTGLLMGLEDLMRLENVDVGRRARVEEEVVVALAEVMDTYAYSYGYGRPPSGIEDWEKEFQPLKEGDVDTLSLALILASQSLPLVAPEKLKALPLSILARLLTSSISSVFQSGTFLSTLSSSTVSSPTHMIKIDHNSPLAQTLQKISSSPLTSSIALLSKTTAMTLSLLLDSRPEEGLFAVAETLGELRDMARKVENDWKDSELAGIQNENDISPDTRELTKAIWTTLKTMLFSTIMIADTTLSTVVYIPPLSSPSSLPLATPSTSTLTSTLPASASIPTPTPSTIALTTLHALSHLAFVISQFGGVTTTSQGFSELKKTFYLALDILAQNAEESDRFTRELCDSFGYETGEDVRSHSQVFQQAKKAHALASIEQLIPVLSDERIQLQVFPLCLPHLYDPAHRETFESAHSVVLAIFAAHAGKSNERVVTDEAMAGNVPQSITRAGFAEKLVPFYTLCLIENSVDGKLSTEQLRLAFSALVGSASASATSGNSSLLTDEQYTLAAYCIEELLIAIRSLKAEAPENEERLHRLHLTLISTVPSLPLKLLPKTLGEIRHIVVALPVEGDRDKRRKELVDALFAEILERVGDREKEFVLRWWYNNRKELIGRDDDVVADGKTESTGGEKQSRPAILSHL